MYHVCFPENNGLGSSPVPHWQAIILQTAPRGLLKSHLTIYMHRWDSLLFVDCAVLIEEDTILITHRSNAWCLTLITHWSTSCAKPLGSCCSVQPGLQRCVHQEDRTTSPRTNGTTPEAKLLRSRLCCPLTVSEKWEHPSHFCKYFITHFHGTTLKKWHFAAMYCSQCTACITV